MTTKQPKHWWSKRSSRHAAETGSNPCGLSDFKLRQVRGIRDVAVTMRNQDKLIETRSVGAQYRDDTIIQLANMVLGEAEQ